MSNISQSEMQRLSSELLFWESDLKSSSSNDLQAQLSGLRRIKGYMRSTMNEDRLSALALMHLHHAKNIDTKTICQMFAAKHKRRMFQSCILYDDDD